MGTLVAGYLAGMLSTLSPCVLPLIPVLLASAVQSHRLGPLALAAGLAVSFASLGLLLASVGFALGLDGGVVRTAAGWVMGLFGLVLLVPALSQGFAALIQPLAGPGGGLLARISGDGIAGQFAVGLLMGAVWSPCTGPTLGAAVGLAASGDNLGEAALVMMAFALGAASPVLALAYGLGGRRKALGTFAQRAKPAMGAVLVAVAALVLTGADKQVETALVAIMPDWLVNLTVMF